MSSAARRCDDFPRRRRSSCGTRQLRRNLGHATRRSAPSGRRSSPSSTDWEAAARGRRGDQARRDGQPGRLPGASSSAAATAAGATVHWARDADEANASWSRASSAGARRARGGQGEVADDRRDRAQRRAHRRRGGADRDRLRRADPAAGRRLVVAHPGAGHPPQPHRDPRPAPAHDRPRRPDATIRPRWPRRPASTCASGSCGPGSASAAPTSRSPRPAPWWCWSRRATAACAPRCRSVLISVVGIEKLLPRFDDLDVFLQLLPRSSTGERMNPYTSIWTGVTPGDGPQRDARRPAGQRPHRRAGGSGRAAQALHCIRCSRLPERVPGLRAHGRPRLRVDLPGADRRDPHAAAGGHRASGRRCPTPPACAAPATRCARSRSTSPRVLVHLRGLAPKPRRSGGRCARWPGCSPTAGRYQRAQRLGRLGGRPLARAAGCGGRRAWAAWTASRDLPAIAAADLQGVVA